MDPSRISLRPFRLSDADDLLNWASHDKVTRYLRWNTITTIEEALSHIQNKAIPHPWRRSICIDDRSIGYVSIRPGSGDDRCRANLGYAVGSEFWGLGIATEALRVAIGNAYKDIQGLVRLQALVEVENKGSERVWEKVGFEREGLLKKYGYCKGEIRDMFMYSFLANDNYHRSAKTALNL